MNESDNQKYCLKWNNFHSNFMTQFETLKEDEDFVDVTLSCYGQSIKAHKVVLSACSPYLKNIFKEHPCKHPVIILDNLSFKNLEAVIQFVYTGQVYVEQTELPSFLKAAEVLQIRGLSDSTSTQNLVQPVQSLSHEMEHNKNATKREMENNNEHMKPPAKRVSRKGSSNLNSDSHESRNTIVENNEIDCNNPSDDKSDDKNENSSLSLLADMESQLENSERRLMMSLKNDDDVDDDGDDDSNIAGEQRKPHWLDPRSCPLCNRVYSNLSNLRQHMKLIHNPTLVTCRLCCKTFKTDLYLRRHLSSFHELNVTSNSWWSVPSHTSVCSQNIKSEPEALNEIFNTGEVYQVPQ